MADVKNDIPEKELSYKGVEVSPANSEVRVGDFVHVHPTAEQEARVLRKIDL